MQVDDFENDMKSRLEARSTDLMDASHETVMALLLYSGIWIALGVMVVVGIFGHAYPGWFMLILICAWGASLWMIRTRLSQIIYLVFATLIESLSDELNERGVVIRWLEQELEGLKQDTQEAIDGA